MADPVAYVIYAANSKAVRRMIVSDTLGFDINDHREPGEIAVEISPTQVNREAAFAAVAAHSGQSVPNTRCAVVNGSNVVVGIISAHPQNDSKPGHTLVLSETAQIGDTLIP